MVIPSSVASISPGTPPLFPMPRKSSDGVVPVAFGVATPGDASAVARRDRGPRVALQRLNLDGARSHAHRMAANAHRGKLAALYHHRQLDKARPSHLETLLDGALVGAIR